MADTEWNVTTFLDKLKNSLTSYKDEQEKKISDLPDIDEKNVWSEWWSGEDYWNKSVIELWNKYKELDNDKSNPDDIKKLKSIKNADAGWRFTGEPYVNPDLNIDNEAYEKVRGDDKIESVLKNSKQMQYTHSQEQKEGSTED